MSIQFIIEFHRIVLDINYGHICVVLNLPLEVIKYSIKDDFGYFIKKIFNERVEIALLQHDPILIASIHLIKKNYI